LRSVGSSLVDKDGLRAFLKEPLQKELGNYSGEQKLAKDSSGALNRAVSLK
jgi:hypothetical protein